MTYRRHELVTMETVQLMEHSYTYLASSAQYYYIFECKYYTNNIIDSDFVFGTLDKQPLKVIKYNM